MFAMTDVDGTGTGVLWFHCGSERFHELLEREGIIASPYLAKAHWVTVERWNVLRPREIEDELRRAHALILEKLPTRTKAVLAMPAGERAKVIGERKKKLAAREKTKSVARCGPSQRGAGRAVPQLMLRFQASVQDGFFLRKNPLGVNGFGTQQLRNRYCRGTNRPATA